MKKSFIIAVLLLAMGSLMAQNQNTREYVSAMITFKADYSVPQDSLDKYGVIVQTRSGRMATALISAENYQAFLNSGLVERVQPSTRVFLRDEQVQPSDNTSVTPRHSRHVARHQDHPSNRENVRRHIIPDEEIRADENKGWYLGLLLGGSTNGLTVDKAMWSGKWYGSRGLNLDARAGYQFNEWLGLRSGLQLISKNYITDLNVAYLDATYDMRTNHENLYLQLPVLADLSVGSEVVRLHIMFGGYAGYWLSQCRSGYVYVADDPRPFTGVSYAFVKDYDQRFELGLSGGLGLTLRVSPDWQLHFEGNYYHGMLSNVKEPYSSFNRTWTFDMGLSYHF